MGLRFTKDPAVPDARFATLRDVLGDGFIAVEIDSSKGNPHGFGRTAHSVLTEHFVDEPGNPTVDALEPRARLLRGTAPLARPARFAPSQSASAERSSAWQTTTPSASTSSISVPVSMMPTCPFHSPWPPAMVIVVMGEGAAPAGRMASL